MLKNKITTLEVRVYRLCHHDFQGLPVCQAANSLGLSIRKVERLLASLKTKAPQLFPILTADQACAYSLYADEGRSIREIAKHVGRDERRVGESIKEAIKAGMPDVGHDHSKMLRYNSSMDNQIREKF